jgi:hypothetical protein
MQVGGMDHPFAHEAFGIHQQVALASVALLRASSPLQAMGAPLFGGFDRLTGNDRGAGRGIPPGLESCHLAQVGGDLFPGTIQAPAPQRVGDGGPRPLLTGQIAP